MLICSAGLLSAALLSACGSGDQGRDPILGIPAATLVGVAVTPATATINIGAKPSADEIASAVWMALAVAAATAALARYCMTSDLDVPEVLQDVIPRPRLLAATGAVLVLSLVAALAIHAKSPGRPDAATTSPDITSLDSLARALQDPSLRRAGDE